MLPRLTHGLNFKRTMQIFPKRNFAVAVEAQANEDDASTNKVSNAFKN
jgi:hypothetical protein